MELQYVLLCAVVLSLASCQYQLDGGQSRAIADYQDDGKHKASVYPQVTVCPEDYSPRDDCVTLDQLMVNNLVASNMTLKFKPAVFELKADSVIRYESVSNITLDSAGAYKVNITCVGGNSGFTFTNVSGLTVQNMMFTGCMANIPTYEANGTIFINESSNVMLDNLTFRHGINGVCASNIHGYFTIQNSVFFRMQGPALLLEFNSSSGLHFQHDSTHEQVTTLISNSQFDSGYSNDLSIGAFAICILYQNWCPGVLHLKDLSITNNTHESTACGIFIWSTAVVLNTTIERVNYINNHVIGQVYTMDEGGSDLLYFVHDDVETAINVIDSNFSNNDFRGNFQANETFNIDMAGYVGLQFYATNSNISIKNTGVSNNSGWYGAAILYDGMTVGANIHCHFLLENSIIASNAINVSDYYEKGAVQLNSIGNITVHNCSILHNSAAGLLIQNSNITFSGYNIIRGNRGYNGGGIALYFDSYLNLLENVGVKAVMGTLKANFFTVHF